MTNRFKLDMTMMYAVHDAFRRDLEPVVNMSARTEGWDLFHLFLHVHHTVEDEALWPVVREMLGGRQASWRSSTRWRTNTPPSRRSSSPSTPHWVAVGPRPKHAPSWPPSCRSTSCTRRRQHCR